MKLYMALELSNTKWKLAFSTGEKIRLITIEARDQLAFQSALKATRDKWQLGEDIEVFSVYEAGRDGFWIHRWLEGLGINNVIVDPASIEVNRRKRRAKTDRLDAKALLRQLIRYHGGEHTLWSVVRVPSVEQEDLRRREREIKRLKKEIGAGTARIKSLLVLHGLRLDSLSKLDTRLDSLLGWDNRPLPEHIRSEIAREYERVEFARTQLKALERARTARIAKPQTKAERQAHKLTRLKAVGVISAMTLSEEFFSWREFRNVRQVGACAGLDGSPYDSGDSKNEQGISKAGNAKVRALMIELAWSWLRNQPQSDLAKWFDNNFARGKRSRRIGIVALARKLLVALWKYLEKDELPAGALLKETA
ncbi:IS110 family RNA-guided transposase [Puniceicoccus vermicola]|uniref:IS110 family transposase n=1 Tax=Puniceicoccus vermicola TaxID=388746 RepID=A0A7X1AZL4_9BACT|nr:IS110 family transposase [Puniceicoccus vermicola]MBC2600256.1 IS110 family transposase [Puniceicoccus vermicola]MBC2600423.1 IS110 family transposase [Puniceicoccus vermicola]MBC2601787.1 IS110 family transposase [Puniceicoccus vermicola]MBC2601858.1 IS110 family transposase [Puniceicoccus vermicola]MBC2601861.1 IS110 family transposase [Puniceicoccus vermicola]